MGGLGSWDGAIPNGKPSREKSYFGVPKPFRLELFRGHQEWNVISNGGRFLMVDFARVAFDKGDRSPGVAIKSGKPF